MTLIDYRLGCRRRRRRRRYPSRIITRVTRTRHYRPDDAAPYRFPDYANAPPRHAPRLSPLLPPLLMR